MGIEILPVSRHYRQDSGVYSEDILGSGTSDVTIGRAGCVVTAYCRIGNAAAANEAADPGEANDVANDLDLYQGTVLDPEERNLLTTTSGARLASEIAQVDLRYAGSVYGTSNQLEAAVQLIDSDPDAQYYVTARIETYATSDTTKRYGHTVNI